MIPKNDDEMEEEIDGALDEGAVPKRPSIVRRRSNMTDEASLALDFIPSHLSRPHLFFLESKKDNQLAFDEFVKPIWCLRVIPIDALFCRMNRQGLQTRTTSASYWPLGGRYTCTEAARSQPEEKAIRPSHDAFTRLLPRTPQDTGELCDEAEPMVSKNSGVLVLDDTTLDIPYSKKIVLVTNHNKSLLSVLASSRVRLSRHAKMQLKLVFHPASRTEAGSPAQKLIFFIDSLQACRSSE